MGCGGGELRACVPAAAGFCGGAHQPLHAVAVARELRQWLARIRVALEARWPRQFGGRTSILRATLVRGGAARREDDSAVRRAGTRGHTAVLPLRELGRRARRARGPGGSRTPAQSPVELGGRFGTAAERQPIAALRLPLSADELAAGMQHGPSFD